MFKTSETGIQKATLGVGYGDCCSVVPGLELGPQQKYISLFCLVSGKQRDPKKAKERRGELILAKVDGNPEFADCWVAVYFSEPGGSEVQPI